MINTTDWKYFKIGDIFEISKCKCGCAGELADGNDIAYIGAKKDDNGVMKYVELESNKHLVSPGNSIVFICDGQGSVGYSIYQDVDFIGSTTLCIGRNQNLNKYNALFVITILDLQRERFSYGRKWAPTLKETKIKLPAKGDKPDWAFMESYVKDQWLKNLETSISKNDDIISVDNWRKFKVSDLFDIERGSLSNLNDIEPGECPIVSAFGAKQGITFFGNVDEKYSNCITASMNGSGTGYFSYHDYCFNANADCGVLIPKFKISKEIALFIVTILNKIAYRYTYGRKLTIDRLSNENILLPSDSLGNPDFNFMEKYIKTISYSDLLEGAKNEN